MINRQSVNEILESSLAGTCVWTRNIGLDSLHDILLLLVTLTVSNWILLLVQYPQ